MNIVHSLSADDDDPNWVIELAFGSGGVIFLRQSDQFGGHDTICLDDDQVIALYQLLETQETS